MKELTERVAQLRADLQEAEHALAEAEAKDGRFRQIPPIQRYHRYPNQAVSRWEDQGLSLAPWAEPARASFRSECRVEFGAWTIWDSHSLCWSWGSLQCSHANSSSPGCFCIFDKAACLASTEPCRDRGLGLNGKWQMDYIHIWDRIWSRCFTMETGMRTADHPSWAARNKILLSCDVAWNLLRRFYIKAARKSFQQVWVWGFLSFEGELDAHPRVSEDSRF